ncbi:RIIa domain-containing protein 1 [Biomphalaria glabrata]|nr:RIIa domain-containing protein 1-like [Biomphalaria glabrata]KAI8793109.1 RIIa domain-containing protein 1 [Biomphalaria glabrata]
MSDQPKHGPPHGMEKHDLGGVNDLGALSQAQQADLNQFKIKTRIGNEKYLREHPEVECLIAGFLSDVLMKRPESIREFAAEYFTNPTLPDKVEKQLASRLEKLKQNRLMKLKTFNVQTA